MDCTLVLDRPKIAPIAHDLRERLAILLDIMPALVSVKAKTPEGLNLDHVAQAHAVVLLESVEAPSGLAVLEEQEELPRAIDGDLDAEFNELVSTEVRAGQRKRTVTPVFDTEDIT